jgi:DNA-binding CsgD family transcriptional regulator
MKRVRVYTNTLNVNLEQIDQKNVSITKKRIYTKNSLKHTLYALTYELCKNLQNKI